MTDFYVKIGGDGSHGASYDPTSDSWAAAYDSINDAVNTGGATAATDNIYCSNLHTKNHTVDVNIFTNCLIMSVDDTSPGSYLAGAGEGAGTGHFKLVPLNYANRLRVIGVNLHAEDEMYLSSTYSAGLFQDLTIDLNLGTAFVSNYIECNAFYGTESVFNNVDIKGAAIATARIFSGGGGGKIKWNGGATISTGGTNPGYLITPDGAGRSFMFEANGVDLSAYAIKIFNAESSTLDGGTRLYLQNCKLPSTFDFGDAPLNPAFCIECTNCGNNNKYTEAVRDFYGVQTMDTSNYRTAGAVVEGTEVSKCIETSADASFYVPFKIRLGSVRGDFSSSGVVITAEFIHDQQGESGDSYKLLNSDIWIEAHIPRSSSEGGNVFIEDDAAASALATGTAQADSTESWTEILTNEVKQKCTVTSSTNGGTGWCDVYLCVAKPSITVYVCPKIDIS